MGKLSLQGQNPDPFQVLAKRPGLLADPLHTGFSEDEEGEGAESLKFHIEPS